MNIGILEAVWSIYTANRSSTWMEKCVSGVTQWGKPPRKRFVLDGLTDPADGNSFIHDGKVK